MGRFWTPRRECGDQTWDSPARVDEPEHRGVQTRAETIRVQLRLAAGNLDLRAGILQVEPVVFPAPAGARAGLPQEKPRELVSEVRHGAGKRTGGERLLLAARRHA